MATKNEKIQLVSLLIIRAYLENPARKLNIKLIAEKAGVSRPWVYKNFGASQEAIILTCIDSVSSDFTEISTTLPTINSKDDWYKLFAAGLHQTLKEVEDYPEIYRFYVHTRIYPGPFSERFQYHEDLFLERRFIPGLMKAFKINLSEAKQLASIIHSFRMGISLMWLNEPQKSDARRRKIVQTALQKVIKF